MNIKYDNLIKSNEVRDIIKYIIGNNIPFTKDETETMTTEKIRFIIGNEDE